MVSRRTLVLLEFAHGRRPPRMGWKDPVWLVRQLPLMQERNPGLEFRRACVKLKHPLTMNHYR